MTISTFAPQQQRLPMPRHNACCGRARHGKSSLIKAIHAAIRSKNLKLIEIHREDIATLPPCSTSCALHRTTASSVLRRFVLRRGDTSYKSLKAALEGGIEGARTT